MYDVGNVGPDIRSDSVIGDSNTDLIYEQYDVKHLNLIFGYLQPVPGILNQILDDVVVFRINSPTNNYPGFWLHCNS